MALQPSKYDDLTVYNPSLSPDFAELMHDAAKMKSTESNEPAEQKKNRSYKVIISKWDQLDEWRRNSKRKLLQVLRNIMSETQDEMTPFEARIQKEMVSLYKSWTLHNISMDKRLRNRFIKAQIILTALYGWEV